MQSELERKITDLDVIDGEILVIETKGGKLLKDQQGLKKRLEEVNEEITSNLQSINKRLMKKFEKEKDDLMKELQEKLEAEFKEEEERLVEKAKKKSQKHLDKSQLITMELGNYRNAIMRLSLKKNKLLGVIQHLGGMIPDQHKTKIPVDVEVKLPEPVIESTEEIPTEIHIPASVFAENKDN